MLVFSLPPTGSPSTTNGNAAATQPEPPEAVVPAFTGVSAWYESTQAQARGAAHAQGAEDVSSEINVPLPDTAACLVREALVCMVWRFQWWW